MPREWSCGRNKKTQFKQQTMKRRQRLINPQLPQSRRFRKHIKKTKRGRRSRKDKKGYVDPPGGGGGAIGTAGAGRGELQTPGGNIGGGGGG